MQPLVKAEQRDAEGKELAAFPLPLLAETLNSRKGATNKEKAVPI